VSVKGKIMQHVESLMTTSVMPSFKMLSILGLAVLAGAISSTAFATLVPEQSVKLPSVQNWQIEAVKRTSNIMCSARPTEEKDHSITLLVDAGKYRGGVWFLQVVSRNQRLKAGVQTSTARLALNDKDVAVGKALEVGDSIGGKRTASYVRYEFAAIDAYVDSIQSASTVQIRADGLNPITLASLSSVIAALKKCQHDSARPEFWR
jgi:tetrahydromethanopterin S-methyltransferase subunit F